MPRSISGYMPEEIWRKAGECRWGRGVGAPGVPSVPCGKAQGALNVQCRTVATCHFQANECAAQQNRLGPWVLHTHACAQTHVGETKSWGACGLLGVAQSPVLGTLPAQGDTLWGGPGRSRSQWAA